MPMRPRNWNSCSSGMVLISSPNTVMVPESGRISPLASLSRTLLPLPAGPNKMRVSPGKTLNEIFSRTFLPSNPMETSSKTRTGCDGSSWTAEVVGWGAVTISSAAEDSDHELADDQVNRDDEHRRNHHRLRRGSAHTLGAAARGHPVIAADAGDDETENNRLDQALNDIGIAQCLVGGVEILRTVLSQHKH